MKRAARMLLLAVVLVAVLFLFVLPGRTYLAQRRSLAAAQTRINVLSRENGKLDQQVQLLQTDAEIERLARQQYGMVKKGEQAYAILPPKPPPTTTPPPAPATAHHGRGLVSQLWRRLQVWRY
jgi:cell division protein FtsB